MLCGLWLVPSLNYFWQMSPSVIFRAVYFLLFAIKLQEPNAWQLHLQQPLSRISAIPPLQTHKPSGTPFHSLWRWEYFYFLACSSDYKRRFTLQFLNKLLSSSKRSQPCFHLLLDQWSTHAAVYSGKIFLYWLIKVQMSRASLSTFRRGKLSDRGSVRVMF